MKICLVGAELCCADGQTDMAKLNIAFRNLAKAPKETKPSSQLPGFVATYQ